jgi:hypothetical protein
MPNPFESFAGQKILILGTKIIIEPIIANWITEAILFPITFAVVGLYYKREMKMPAVGSILYLVFYCIHTGIVYLFCKLSFSPVLCILLIIGYATLLIIIKIKISMHKQACL